jgi:F0F1-type ATP synthase assembly protein I
MKPPEPVTHDEKPESPTLVKLVDSVLPRAPKKSGQNHRNNPMSALGLSTQLSLAISGSLIGSIMIGIYLDRLVGRNGLFVSVMILIGLGCGAFVAWRIIKNELQ